MVYPEKNVYSALSLYYVPGSNLLHFVIFIQERHNLIRTQMFAAKIARDPQNLTCFPDIREFSCNRLALHVCMQDQFYTLHNVLLY